MIMKLIRESFYIVLASIVIGFMINIIHPNGYILISKSQFENKNIVFISTKEAKIKFDKSIAVFVDSRGLNRYRESHINGAVNIPASPISLSFKKIKSHFSLLNTPDELVIYCSGKSCSDSESLAKRIIKMGYLRNIYIIKDGLSAWKGQGYPVEGR